MKKIIYFDPKRIKKIRLTEHDIKNQIKEYLSLKNWFHFPLLAGLGAYKGCPDMIALKDGIVLFIEIKVEKGRQSQYQQEFQKNIEKYGGKYLIIRGIEDLQKEGI